MINTPTFNKLKEIFSILIDFDIMSYLGVPPNEDQAEFSQKQGFNTWLMIPPSYDLDYETELLIYYDGFSNDKMTIMSQISSKVIPLFEEYGFVAEISHLDQTIFIQDTDNYTPNELEMENSPCKILSSLIDEMIYSSQEEDKFTIDFQEGKVIISNINPLDFLANYDATWQLNHVFEIEEEENSVTLLW